MNVPNMLSLFRLILVPVFAVVFFQPTPHARTVAVSIYLVAFLTDVADGWIARHFNQITRLGRILDPFADKLMTFTVIVCITTQGIVPLWAVVVFFLKELVMALGGMYMYRKLGDVISSNWIGKSSTFVFFLVCVALVLFPDIPSDWAAGMIAAALALTVVALMSYTLQCLKILDKRKAD